MQRLRLIINGESARDRFNYVTSPEMAIPIETNVSEIGFNQCAKRNWRMYIRSIYLDTQRYSRFVETATRSLIINLRPSRFRSYLFSSAEVSINLRDSFFFLTKDSRSINKSRESWKFEVELKRLSAKEKLKIDRKYLPKYLFANIARKYSRITQRHSRVIVRKTSNCLAGSPIVIHIRNIISLTSALLRVAFPGRRAVG